jgi:hypothetical protein
MRSWKGDTPASNLKSRERLEMTNRLKLSRVFHGTHLVFNRGDEGAMMVDVRDVRKLSTEIAEGGWILTINDDLLICFVSSEDFDGMNDICHHVNQVKQQAVTPIRVEGPVNLVLSGPDGCFSVKHPIKVEGEVRLSGDLDVDLER